MEGSWGRDAMVYGWTWGTGRWRRASTLHARHAPCVRPYLGPNDEVGEGWIGITGLVFLRRPLDRIRTETQQWLSATVQLIANDSNLPENEWLKDYYYMNVLTKSGLDRCPWMAKVMFLVSNSVSSSVAAGLLLDMRQSKWRTSARREGGPRLKL